LENGSLQDSARPTYIKEKYLDFFSKVGNHAEDKVKPLLWKVIPELMLRNITMVGASYIFSLSNISEELTPW